MILNLTEPTKSFSQSAINWRTSEVVKCPLREKVFEDTEICEQLPIGLSFSTILPLALAHFDYSEDEEPCLTNTISNINFGREEYAPVSSLPFNQENVPAGNVVDRHNCDGTEAAHLQCQSDGDAMPVTSNAQTDDEELFLEPDFIELEQVTLNYSNSYHPLNCQCLKLKLDSSLVIYISPAKKIALLLNK